ncbi:MAG: hypothetical protein RLZZ408_653 [Verrucomicrobiota bacterium]|jgi:hypothetical protein
MALYYLQEDASSTGSSGSKGSMENKGKGASHGRWIAYVAAVLIAAAALLQALGLEPFSLSLSQAPRFLPTGFLPATPKIIWLSMQPEAGGFVPLDVAMALRGLGKLNPSRIVFLGKVNKDPDSLTLLEGIQGRLRENGIRVIEEIVPSVQSLWRPVPLCRYNPPAPLILESPLPKIEGKVTPEGKESFPAGFGELTFPLFRVTDAGDVAGSVWWEMLLPTKVNGPFWLLGGRLLLFPNHAPLLLSQGALRILPPPSPVTVMPLDLFLLRIEEKERGMIRPDFETLWEGATVVLGESGKEDSISRITTLRENMAIGRLPLIAQAMITAMLIIALLASGRYSRATRLCSALALLVISIGTGTVALHHGLLLPILPAILTALFLCVLNPADPMRFSKRNP